MKYTMDGVTLQAKEGWRGETASGNIAQPPLTFEGAMIISLILLLATALFVIRALEKEMKRG